MLQIWNTPAKFTASSPTHALMADTSVPPDLLFDLDGLTRIAGCRGVQSPSFTRRIARTPRRNRARRRYNGHGAGSIGVQRAWIASGGVAG